MKRSTKIVIAAALTVGLVGGAAAVGKHRFGDSEKRRAHMISHVADELELNSDQTTSLNTLVDEMMSIKQQMHAEFGEDMSGLEAMITSEQFDQTRALDMVNSKTDAIKQNAPGVIAALGNFLDGLSAEQKAEIADHMKERKRHHRKHGKHRNHDNR